MDSDAVDTIENLVRKSCEPLELDNRTYTYQNISPVRPPIPETLSLMSLKSLVDFSATLDLKEWMFQVESPTRVHLVQTSYNHHAQRSCVASSDISRHVDNFDYGHEYDLESFVINLQSCFKTTENLLNLIDAISNVKIDNENEIIDSGITQEVSAKSGIHLKRLISLPNPIELAPYRTFPEIEPEEESFIFRVSKGRGDTPTFKLINSKSLSWEIRTVDKIKKHLIGNSKMRAI